MAESEIPEPASFSRGLITDWYDGATSGFLKAEPGVLVYDFRMVAWDDGQDSRIYVLRPLTVAMDDLASAFFGAGCRMDGWRVLMAEDPGDLNLDREYLRSAGPPAFIVLSDDCLATASGVRRIADDDRQKLESWLLDSESEMDGYAYSDLLFEHWIALFR